MPRHHIIISGTGRAGTTFLVQLLTELGLDTGFPRAVSQTDANSNAGMELDIRDIKAPYIIKNPWLCDYLDEIHDVPLVLLLFPRFVSDPEYLYQKIKFALGDIDYSTFFKTFQTVSRPELIHDFTLQENKPGYFRNSKK